MTEDGNYFYFAHSSWTSAECALMLLAVFGEDITEDQWEEAIESSNKSFDGEIGRVGGLIFVSSDGPSFA